MNKRQISTEMNSHPEDKIVLENCPSGCEELKKVLIDINRFFYESNQYQHNKEYQLSIVSLKKAFKKTYELKSPLEQECAKVFRSTVLESLKNIHHELKRMTSGFFRKNHYKFSTILAEKTLEELGQKPAGELVNITFGTKNSTPKVVV